MGTPKFDIPNSQASGLSVISPQLVLSDDSSESDDNNEEIYVSKTDSITLKQQGISLPKLRAAKMDTSISSDSESDSERNGGFFSSMTGKIKNALDIDNDNNNNEKSITGEGRVGINGFSTSVNAF